MANYTRIYLNGYSYFITVVTHLREPILVENIDLLRQSFRETKQYYKFTIDVITVLPDHFHMIITPEEAKEYPRIIQSIKYNFTRRYQCRDEISQSMSRDKDKMQPVWQKRYYEHTIRNAKDWEEKILYIRNNPVKHELVHRWIDWQYSSFQL